MAVTGLRLLLTGRRANRCRRPATSEVGHRWWVYQAEASGPLRASAREVRAPRWIHPGQLQQYAQRTAAHADGRLSEHEFAQEPGLEPVWVRLLHDLQLVTMSGDALAWIDTVI
ncbi:hypothetical protein AB0O34_26485 [Sphaerisporangium sp. NPDC088356]|uniref:hypothetical protein n=1 Tax=Sphaerisporangium sp. NPDC088356 TaxID=3154871 RepID=UPI00341847ED